MEMNDYSTELMTRQMQTLMRATKAGIHYISGLDSWCIPFMNELSNKLKVNKKIGYFESIHSIWFTDGTQGTLKGPEAARISVDVVDSHWNSYRYDSGHWFPSSKKDKRMSIEILEMVLDCFDKMSEFCENKKAKNASNPDVSELMNDFLALAEKNIKEGYKVSLRRGKLVKEGNMPSYECLVVEYAEGGYAGSIVFGKDVYGDYTIKHRVPLAGECSWSFQLETAEEEIKSALQFICN